MKKFINNKLFFYIPLLIIMLISFLNMQNAKLLSSIFKNNLNKQIIWYIIGFLIIIIFKKINIKAFLKYSKFYYIISIMLLILVLIFGNNINGSKAWFNLGFFSFQPSELAKISLVLYLSYISKNFNNNSIKDEFFYILKLFIITLIPSILVFLEPDTGAIIFFILTFLTIMITSKIHKRWFILFFIFLFILLTIFILLFLFNQDLLIKLIGTSFFYRVERLMSFKSASNYQLENAFIAMGSTSFLGTGINKISLYIPEAPTDFIFAFTISNFGILTGFLVLISYLFINIYFLNKYYLEKDKLIKKILASFIVMFIFNQVINIGMNLGMFPIIGIPLPFLSYGGSTLIIYFIFLGIFLNHFNKKID